ncbi:Os07g0423550 [Oryza sativa Japonica Group]|uniref:Os07g0423550 protein n=1 Tax=Oryza sativa subsp. japonica TaxID=39947 RepID=A0A0P0X5C5_ORYSJ|nr:Os07g0423550 [Oryza sativa Japonica Group]
MTAAASSLSSSRSPSAPSSSPAARLPAARMLRWPAAPCAVGGGEPTWMFCCARFPRMGTGCCFVVTTIAKHSVPSCTVTNAFSGFIAAAELQRQVRTRLFGLLPAGCTHEVIQDQ